MKTIAEAYPDLDDDFGWGGPGDYGPLLRSFEYDQQFLVYDKDDIAVIAKGLGITLA